MPSLRFQVVAAAFLLQLLLLSNCCWATSAPVDTAAAAIAARISLQRHHCSSLPPYVKKMVESAGNKGAQLEKTPTPSPNSGEAYLLQSEAISSSPPSNRSSSSSVLLPQVSEVDLSSFAWSYVYGEVNVSGNVVPVLFDTGSPLLWVEGSLLFEPVLMSNIPLEIDYAKGMLTGWFGIANVSLGSSLSLAADYYVFGIAVDTSQMPLSGPAKGVLGLSLGGVTSGFLTPMLIPQLHSEGKIPAAAFSMYLDPFLNGGEVSLGGYDEAKFEGDLHWFEAEKELPWWTVHIEDMALGYLGALFTPQGSSAIVDSGTSLLVGPRAWLEQAFWGIQRAVPATRAGDALAIFCRDAPLLPNLTFSVVKTEYFGLVRTASVFSIPPQFYVSQPLSAYDALHGSCRVMLMTLPENPYAPNFILGDPFMRAFYSVFDYTSKSIGLAATSGLKGASIEVEVSLSWWRAAILGLLGVSIALWAGTEVGRACSSCCLFGRKMRRPPQQQQRLKSADLRRPLLGEASVV